MKQLHSLKLSLRNRLLIGIGAMLVPLVGLGVGAFVCLESAVKAFEETAKEVDKEMFPLTRLQTLVVQASIPVDNYLLYGNTNERDRFNRLSNEIDSIFTDTLEYGFLDRRQEQVLVRSAYKEWQSARRLGETIFARPDSLRNRRLAQYMERVDAHTDLSVDLLNKAYKVAHEEIADDLAQARAIKWRGLLIVAIVFGLGLCAVLAISLILARSILLPLRVLADGVGRFGEGELDYRIILTSRDELGELALMFNLMASKLQHNQSALKQLASVDTLTGLPNRALFMDRLKQAVLRAKTCEECVFAVLFVDLDRFKLVNDSLGHLVGDELLIATARRLARCLRDEDTIARLGGDEFALLLNNITDVSMAAEVAERIKQKLAKPFELRGHKVFVSASVGVVIGNKASDCLDDLLRNADLAMYRAKALGKAGYQIFDTQMHTQAVMRLQIETDLQRGIEHQEFQVYYQPIVLLETGMLTGFEALVRWKHPQRGFVSPSEFIRVAEETGLIIPLGRWILNEACRQMHVWQQQFPTLPLTLSVNVSAKQFTQSDFTQQIVQILDETKLDARSLKLELTESVLMDNAEFVTDVLWQLKALGFSLYLDDFGTGHSSLSYLHRFPIHTLKIDRSFINKIGCADKNLEIIRAITMLSQAMGMDAIAEGIETPQQLAQLRELECKYGQGHYFSQPLDSAAAEALIAQQQAYLNVSVPLPNQKKNLQGTEIQTQVQAIAGRVNVNA